MKLFVLARAITYAVLFIGLVLIYIPARLLSWSGIVRPTGIEVQQLAGMVLGAAGAAVALWCILTFATLGRGTPAQPQLELTPQRHSCYGISKPGIFRPARRADPQRSTGS